MDVRSFLAFLLPLFALGGAFFSDDASAFGFLPAGWASVRT